MPGANQLWMLVGFELFRIIGARYECIEVYPHATAVALGAAGKHKRHNDGVHAQLEAVTRETGWPPIPDVAALKDIGYGSRDDKLDAYLSCWVASLEPELRAASGEPPGDVIWVPRVATRHEDGSWSVENSK